MTLSDKNTRTLLAAFRVERKWEVLFIAALVQAPKCGGAVSFLPFREKSTVKTVANALCSHWGLLFVVGRGAGNVGWHFRADRLMASSGRAPAE